MKKISGLLFTVCLVLCTACQSAQPPGLPDDALMQHLLQHNPDSLALLLEDHINPPELPDSGKAAYAYWLVKTHQQQYRSLMNDTLILFALDYYKKTDAPRLPDTYLMAASQLNWAGDLLKSRQLLEEGLLLAAGRKDTGNIHIFCSNMILMYNLSNETVKTNELIQITEKYLNGTSALPYSNLCRLFILLNQPDSVAKYARAGAGLARREGNRLLEYGLTRSYVEALNASGKGKEALAVLRELKKNIPAGNELNINFISVWIGLNEIDSARAYMDSLQFVVNKYRYKVPEEANVVESVLGMFEIIIQTRNGKTAWYFTMAKTLDHIFSDSRRMIANNRERQLVENRLLKENMTLDIERGQLHQRILWICLFVLSVIAVLILVYQRKLLTKERSVQQAGELLRHYIIQLSENESIIAGNEELIQSLSAQLDESRDLKQEINLLVDENETLKQKNRQLHKDIDYYSESVGTKDREADTFEKFAKENAKLHERERFLTARLITHTKELDQLAKKPRYIEDSRWPEIIHAVNQVFDGFSYRLHVDYPSLTEEDIRYACLIKLRLSTSVIASLTGISPSSVTKRKQRIKEKINQQHPSEIRKEQPLEIYLWNRY